MPGAARSLSAPAEAEAPAALTERGATGIRLVALTPSVRARGLAAGMTLADARARLPELASREIDRAADARALAALALWATRWSPTVALDGRDGLALDVTGAAHLWGGEAGLLADISARLDRARIAHRLGLGPTLGAAWALAHTAPGPITRLEGATEAERLGGIADLSVAGLRLGEEARTLLRRFGLGRIGQLAEIDRAALARRFRDGAVPARAAEAVADQALLRLDQALGRVGEPLAPIQAPPRHVARLPCPEPVADLAGLEAGLETLLARLSTELAAAGRGARRLTLRAYRADGTTGEIAAQAARPTREAAHWARLFAERLPGLDPGYGVDLLRLEAAGLAEMAAAEAPRRLEAAPGEADPAALAALADRIAARLGRQAVEAALPAESHRPEYAERWGPFEGELADWSAAPPGPWGARPLRRLSRPEPAEVIAEVPDGPPVRVVWRRRARRVVRAEGPERLGPDWWRAGGPTEMRARDCYLVEDAEGLRLWLCRDGLYGDGRGGAPVWQVHGLFA